jgi:Uma2 family endonuclease
MARAQLELANLLPATFTAPEMSEEEFFALCERFPDATVEYAQDWTVIIMPPTDPETGARVAYVARKLGDWADEQRRGIVVGPDSGFRFPKGARRSPDAAWFDAERWRAAKRPGTRFPVFAPEFVIEVRSPDDRPLALREKMQEYMANGVLLGWLIDPPERTVTIYRPEREHEVLENPASVAGEGPVEGFVLSLERVFARA